MPMHGVGFSYYDILGVSPNATTEEIKTAYRSAVRKYHPDVNAAPNAQRLTEMLNDAYAVLSDANRRREYDNAIAGGSPTVEAQEPANQVWDLYACDKCGRVDVHLRYALFFRVWSILIYSQMKGDGGVLCPECRSKLAISTVLFSVILGPWGFPWGIFYTIRALAASLRGGEMPRAENAQLLRHQGVAFLQRGLINEARTALTTAQRFERNTGVTDLLADNEIFGISTELPSPGWLKGQTIAAFSWAIPIVLLFIFFAAIGSNDNTAAGSGTTSNASAAQAAASPGATAQDGDSAGNLSTNESACLSDAKNERWINAYSDCRAARSDTVARITASTTQSERDGYALVGAIEEFNEAVGASKSGYDSAAKQFARESVAAFDRLRNSADADVRAQATRYYNCYGLDRCPK